MKHLKTEKKALYHLANFITVASPSNPGLVCAVLFGCWK